MNNLIFRLFSCFFRIGIFNFGGGYAMLPLIYQSIQDIGFMRSSEFSDLVALSQVTPGPIAVNAATYVGFKSAGFAGAGAATFGVALPSFILVLTALHFLEKFKGNGLIESVFSGIRPAVVGLIASAALMIGISALFSADMGGSFARLFAEGGVAEFVLSARPLPLLIAALSFVLAARFKWSPIKISLAAAVFGALFC